MATQQIEFEAPSGMTLTAKLYASGSDTVAYTASAVTEQTNRKGVYRATFASVTANTYQLVATSGTTAVAVWWGYAEDTATTFQFGANAGAIGIEAITSNSIAANAIGASELAADAGTELATAVWANATRTITGGTVTTVSDKTGYSLVANTGLGNQTANITGNISGSVGSVTSAVTVGTNNDKTGYGLANGSIAAATFAANAITASSLAADSVLEIADGIWDELMSGHSIAGSYGAHFVRSANQNQSTVQITGSQHIAADIHELQPAVIDSSHFSANAIDANALATSAVTEIADAVGGGGAGGAGSVSVPFTVTDNASNPIDGVALWVSTDSAGTNVIAGTIYTNGSGLATFMLDPGTYYVWLQRNGYNFTNPQTLTVT